MDSAILTAISATLAGSVLSLIATLVPRMFRRAFERDEQEERSRLRNEILGPNVVVHEGPVTVREVLAEPGPSTRKLRDFLISSSAKDGEVKADIPTQPAVRGDAKEAEEPGLQEPGHHARFAVLLVDYYAYGLTQARRSFAVSLSFSFLGGVVLIAGVSLAIFHADTNGQAYAAVVTSLAGVLTSSIGALFHHQAARALKHMEEQTNKLRQDMKAERDTDAAVQLLEHVGDAQLKGWLQAALILQFSRAKLPDIAALNLPSRRSSGGRRNATAIDGNEFTPSEFTPGSNGT